MAAARHIPRTETTQTITFGANFNPTPPAVIIASGTIVDFVNNSTSTITLTFAQNPITATGPTLFESVTLQPGDSDSQSPTAAAGSCNYTVTAGGTIYGPFSIQVDTTSPLIVQISYIGTSGDCQPPTVTLPIGGKFQMISTDSQSYPVKWEGGVNNPFNPALISVNAKGGQNNICTAIAPVSTNPYVYSVASPGPGAGNGGGKVIIKS
ncbi:MAG: hypothetical protein WAU58_00795 [Terriglobales bacterium]|jgi:hypothetical protein